MLDAEGARGEGQPPVEPRLGESAAFTVIAVGRLLQRRLEASLEGEGVTMRHLGALGHLRARERSGDPVSVTDLARRAGITVQSMHATIGQLVAKGAIVRGTGARQGRSADLTVTEEGYRILRLAGTLAADLDTTVLADLPPAATDALRALAMSLVTSASDDNHITTKSKPD